MQAHNGSRLEGIEVPLHQSLVEPMTLLGLPRSVALPVWLPTAALVFALHQIWFLPVGIVLHIVCAAVAKSDPYFFDLLPAALRTQRRLDP
jgi:type IV secretion system protein VirB3